ncbi:MAG: ABC transporter permease, partial [Gemmatimonadaceae bacterium]
MTRTDPRVPGPCVPGVPPPPSQPPPPSAAERLHRALLRTYPAAFRAEYGEEMERFVRDRVGEARYGTGWIARARLCAHVLLDAARTAPREHGRALVSRVRGTPGTDDVPPGDHTRGDVMDMLLQDARFALRTLARRPVFATVAIATLALGIGATTAIFSVVNALLLRPLLLPEPDRVLMVWDATAAAPRGQVSYPDWLEWRAGARSFEALAIMRGQSVNLTGGDEPERLAGSFVSADFWPVLRAAPALGRGFSRAETELPTAEPVAVVSDGLWRRRFGGDPALLGRSLTLNGRAFTVVGIMPATAPLFGATDVWLPIPYYPNANGFDRGQGSMTVMGRLRAGATSARASAELGAIARREAERYPATNAGHGIMVEPLHETLVGDLRPVLLILLGAVALVLLIACANVANLQLAHAAARRREISVRAALGAGRARLVRQLLTESLILSALGGALGAALAHVAARALAGIVPLDTASFAPIAVDARVLGFAAAVSLLTGTLFGLVPAVHGSRADLGASLKRGTHRFVPGLGRVSARDVFVVAQVALSIVLLVGAGLLTRSLIRLRGADPGFDPRGVLTMEFRLPATKYADDARVADFFTRALAAIRAVPGVRGAALVRAVPLSGNAENLPYIVEGRPAARDAADAPAVHRNIVSPGYFRTMAIPLVAGRDFTDADGPTAPGVVVVNAELARREWPGQPAVGKRIRLGDGDAPWLTVVGVVGNAKHYALSDAPFTQGYIPYRQKPLIFTSIVVRAAGNPLALAGAVRGAIWQVDRDQPVWRVRTMEEVLAGSVEQQRVTTRLLGAFAALALLLAGVGVYGVMSYAVAQRAHEVGLRMALGAKRGQVLALVVRRGMALAAVAIVIGLATALAATGALASQLFGVSRLDPVTFGAVPAVLAV